jgi:hypothetical protein
MIDVKAHARRILDELHETVGIGGFHPDEDISSYVNADGSPWELPQEQRDLMQAALDFCRAALGEECYELGLAKMRVVENLQAELKEACRRGGVDPDPILRAMGFTE